MRREVVRREVVIRIIPKVISSISGGPSTNRHRDVIAPPRERGETPGHPGSREADGSYPGRLALPKRMPDREMDDMAMRSLLFAPANRADLLAKLPSVPADCYAPDLEDGTPPADREGARASLAANLATIRAGRPDARLFVRVNAIGTPDHAADMAAALAAKADGIVLPKAETPADIAALGGVLPVIAGIESVLGVVDVMAIAAAPGVLAVYFGAEDFAAAMGGRRTPDGVEVLYARSQIVLAAKAARVLALDQVVTNIRDDDLFRRDATQARNLGYDGKMCLLPRQVALAHEAFGPSASELDHARRLIQAYEAAAARGAGTIDFEGQMVDPPILKAAQAVLAAAGILRV